MAKEWILNNSMNRFQLNFKRNVGATSESIRKCAPKTMEQWRKYYFENVRSKEHIEELGRKLYIKITEVIQAEVEEISENDCIDYMLEMVIDRTYDGYVTEIKTIYGQLQAVLKEEFNDVKIEPAPDKWDRLFNVDFFISVGNHYIGIQIKPVTYDHLPEVHKWKEWTRNSHQKFHEKYGGNVFIVFSAKQGSKKVIVNPDVIDAIRNEIARLQNI